ncbi:MAG: glycosyltransferase, partial [Pedobacter sp.]
MKIGIIAHLKHPIIAPFKGGLEAFTYNIAERLVALGHEVLLFASSGSCAKLPLVPILSDEHYDPNTGIRKKQHDLPSEYIAEHHAYFELMTTIDSHNLDIIFNNSLHYIPITMANTVRTPMATVLHTPPFYELQLAIKKEQENPCVQYVTVSQQSAKNWSTLVKNCKVITNGIDITSWKFYPQSATERYAVWFGRIHPDKGLHFAIAAAKKAGIPLKIAGGIADQKYFAQQVAPLLDDSIELLGLCDHNQLNQIIGEAAVALVTPTWEEPFGLVLAEAMTCGTPIAGFQIGALTEVVTEGTGYLVATGDTDALASAVTKAEKLDRTYIRQYAEKHFEIDHMVEKYEELLESIIAKSDISDALKKIAANASQSDDPTQPALQEIEWLREAGALTITLPGAPLDFNKGNTPELLQLLKDVGKANLSIGRIYEGHINALHLVHLYATDTQREQWYKDAEAGMLFGVWNTQAG